MSKVYQLGPHELALSKLNRANELAWSLLENSLFVRMQQGDALSLCLPDLSFDAAKKRAALGEEILGLLDDIDESLLPHDSVLSAGLIRYYAENWAKDAKRYWLCVELSGQMFYGPFVQTAYTSGFIFNIISSALAQVTFTEDADGDRYLAILSDVVRFLRQIHTRTAGQAERGIRIHRVQLGGVRDLLSGLKSSMSQQLRVSANRLVKLSDPEAVEAAVNRRIDTQISPAFDALLAQLDQDYENAAPDGVGLDKLPGGREIYLELLKMHTTLDLSLEQVHRTGVSRMERIEAQMKEVRLALGFTGSATGFLEHLRSEPRACAENADAIGNKMRHHMHKIDARFDEFFVQRSSVDFDVKRLDSALESSMTWGYYWPPSVSEPCGYYHYNGACLDSQAVIGAASLIFHELMPGHHLHLTTQANNTDILPIRRFAFVNAYNEGWAEYAATLAGEMGLYDDPYDRYGRLILDAFLTCRLVVDTGMNAMDWSWEEAKAYLRAHTLCTESEINTDTLRYACGIPAQSLAYKLGDEDILRLRQKVMDALGDAFDYRGFHSAVLGPGGLPLSVLASHLDWYVNQQLESSMSDIG